MSSDRCPGSHVQPNVRPVSLQRWRDRINVQSLCQRLPAEQVAHCPVCPWVTLSMPSLWIWAWSHKLNSDVCIIFFFFLHVRVVASKPLTRNSLVFWDIIGLNRVDAFNIRAKNYFFPSVQILANREFRQPSVFQFRSSRGCLLHRATRNAYDGVFGHTQAECSVTGV